MSPIANVSCSLDFSTNFSHFVYFFVRGHSSFYSFYCLTRWLWRVYASFKAEVNGIPFVGAGDNAENGIQAKT